MTDPSSAITVLLATYNGSRFLDEQLESIANQDVPAIDIIVSDDGSTDGTVEKLRQWQRRWNKGRFEIVAGPGQGFSENFRSLIRLPVGTAYVAYADQDDVWKSDKLSAAIAQIEQVRQGPVLYCSRTELVAQDGSPMGMSPLFVRRPDFRNAIVQSIGGGNTMVMNREAAGIVRESAVRTSFVSHDWWAYIIVSGCGGSVLYDAVPRILYRQHDQNLVGKNTGFLARLSRMRHLLQGRFGAWMDINLAGLERCMDMLTPEARAIVQEFAAIRKMSGPAALKRLRRLGIYRQTTGANLGLWVATLLRKL